VDPGLVYDYKNGQVIDARSGEVVDTIYTATPEDGFERGGHDLPERVHYEKWFEPLPKDVWFVFKSAVLYLKNARGAAIDEKLLVKLSREAWLQVHGLFRSGEKQRIAAAAASYVYLKLAGLYTDLEEVCRGLWLGALECSAASRAALRLSTQFKPDRVKTIANLINRHPNPVLRAAALVLLKHARIDGKSSRAVAATLLYLAGIITGNEVPQREAAEFFGAHEVAIRLSLAKPSIINIKITKSRAGVPLVAEVPNEICREIEKFASLSEKVVCV